MRLACSSFLCFLGLYSKKYSAQKKALPAKGNIQTRHDQSAYAVAWNRRFQVYSQVQVRSGSGRSLKSDRPAPHDLVCCIAPCHTPVRRLTITAKALVSQASPHKAYVTRASFNKAPVYQDSPQKAPVIQASAHKAPVSQASFNKAHVCQDSFNKAPVSQASCNKAPVSQASPHKAHVSQASPHKAHVTPISPHKHL